MPGSAVLQLVLVWQAKKAAAEKKAAEEEAEKVPSSPTLDGCGLRRTASDMNAHALSGDIGLIRTVRCVRPPPCDCA